MATTAERSAVRHGPTRGMASGIARGAAGGAIAGHGVRGGDDVIHGKHRKTSDDALDDDRGDVQGEDALAGGTASPAVGVAVHLAMSVGFGFIKVVAPSLFPWFGEANQPFELTIHVVFGVLLSFALFHMSGRKERVLDARRAG